MPSNSSATPRARRFRTLLWRAVRRTVPERPLLIGTAAFVVLFPIWFFRYARSLWLGFDQFVDPRP